MSLLRLPAAFLLVLTAAAQAAPGDLPEGKVQAIIDTYAGNVYRRGQTTSLVVGVTLNGKTSFRAYGHRSFDDQSGGNAVDEHSIFEIGSVTKVWTTALAGQAVATGGLTTRPVGLYTPLGSFPHPLPGLQDAMKLATLGDLASFTAGFPDVGDTDGQGHRPPISAWGVADFTGAIAELVPLNYNKKPPQPSGLPAPYFYSDWSTGLLGLLVANNLDAPLPADAVERWEDAVEQNLVVPLGMQDTYLFDPQPAQAPRVVLGYEQATAEAVVNSNRITSIKVNSAGGRYSAAPAVTIQQPGGSGATATAVMTGTAPNMSVRRIVVNNPGSGYRAPPKVTFGGPGSGAQAQAVVLDGKIAGIQMLSGGKGYTAASKIGFSAKHGSGAAATALVSGGSIVGAVVTNPGSGYNAPPVVQIAPGDNIVNVVPVWAAAGALKSSASDLLKLCQLHLGQQEIGGNPVPADLALGARYALLPLIQNTPSTPAKFTGMTWAVDNGFIGGGLNLVISKDGALPGFATYVSLVPAVNLGVVILRANNQSGRAEYADPIGSVANAITTAIQMELLGTE